VRDPGRQVHRLLLELAQLLVEVLPPLAQLAHGGDRPGRVAAGLLEPGDVLARRVAPGLELLGLVQQREPALLDLVEGREVELYALEGDAGLDPVAVLAEELEIVHGTPGAWARAGEVRSDRAAAWRGSERESAPACKATRRLRVGRPLVPDLAREALALHIAARQLARARVGHARLVVAAELGERHPQPVERRGVVRAHDGGCGVSLRRHGVVAAAVGGVPGIDERLGAQPRALGRGDLARGSGLPAAARACRGQQQ